MSGETISFDPETGQEEDLEGMQLRSPGKRSSLTPTEQEKLRQYRMRLAGAGGGPLSDVERAEFVRLGAIEQAREGALDAQERAEYFELTRRQMNNENWTPQDADRVAELQRRLDQDNRARRN